MLGLAGRILLPGLENPENLITELLYRYLPPLGIALFVGAILSAFMSAARRQGRRLQKISGIDLMDQLCGRAAERGWRVFLLGAAPGVADAAGKELLLRHPRLSIVGTAHGYFEPDTSAPSANPRESEVLARVASARPDLLFVALSTPRQDGWIHQNLHRLGAKVLLGVGGSFDVISGRLRRAPAWMRTVGLEWFFRLLQEPRRAGRMRGLPLFVARILCWNKNP
jgi:N-acetylglucosaminyldiphosphoundecaprenol N-acetyl-beta-D-mannosaminyltransferase